MLSVVEIPSVQEHCNNRPYYHGMLAFAAEENGQLEKAEIAVSKGLAINAHDPWVYHAKAVNRK
jgi:hypothetical protein